MLEMEDLKTRRTVLSSPCWKRSFGIRVIFVFVVYFSDEWKEFQQQ